MYRNFLAFGICIALVSCVTKVSCQAGRCLGDYNYCSGQFGDMKAVCKDGYCYCTGQDYDYNTCLPDAYGCKIVQNDDAALAKPQLNNQPRNTYSCTPGSSSTQYEVHVLSMYVDGNPDVNIVSQGNRSHRPIVLVLGSYETVTWNLKIPAGVTISKVILVSYHQSSVSGISDQLVERKNRQWGWGYGTDLGGGDTVALLRQVHSIYGVVTSFTGTYRADEWTLMLSSVNGSGAGIINSSTAATTTPTPIVTSTSIPTPTPTNTPKPTVHRQKCYKWANSYHCSGGYKMNAVCKDGYCVCTGQGYNYESCLPDAYGCKIVQNDDAALAKPQFNNKPQNTHSCTPGSSSAQYEVHVVSMYEGNSHTRPPTAGDTIVNIISRGNSGRPIVLVLGSYEPVHWILKIPAGVTISKVILVAFYIAQSSVSGVSDQLIERKNYQWGWGFGTDSGGGDTVALLRQVHSIYGVVTSFTGTYRADEWTLMLSSVNGSGAGIINSTTAATTTPTPTVTSTSIPTPTPTNTPKPTVHRQKCYYWANSYHCSGGYKMNVVCRDGYCVCTGQGYNYESCLPDAYGCKIVQNDDKSLAKPQYNNQPPDTYSCTPDSSSTQYEVHVLSVYEGNFPGSADVNIVSQEKSHRPIVLVLGSYNRVHWILKIPAGVTISKVIVVAYYIDESSVSGDVNQVQTVEKKGTRGSPWNSGYGSDSGGGGTVDMLKQVYSLFGVVTSFTGTYKADKWTLVLSSPHGPGFGNISSSVATPTTATPTPTNTPTVKPTVHRQKCYKWANSYHCSGGYKMNAVCKDGYCVCTGQGYNYESCLPDTNGCQIVQGADSALAKPLYNNQPQTTYSCTPSSSSSQYEVHVISMYQVINRRPPTAGDAIVNVISRGNSGRPIVLVLGSYEPVHWILKIPAGITISKVILVSYYIAQSSVSGVSDQLVERKNYQWGWGFGTDSGGGDTVALLRQVYSKYGVVTSFTGTYKADEWFLVLSSPKAGPSPPCRDYACLSKAVQKLDKTVRQLKEEMKSQQKRIAALEQLKKSSGIQYQQQADPQNSSGLRTCKTMEKLLWVFVSVLIVTYTY